MIEASCLCEAVKFQAEDIPGMIFNCHCSRCRRSHGAAFATQVVCLKSSLIFVSGKEFVSEYKFEGIKRCFCSKCGSRLLNATESDGYLSVSLTTIQGRPDLKPVAECFAIDRLSFVLLDPSIPHFEGFPNQR